MSLSPERNGRLTASVFANAIGIGYDSRQKLFRQLTGREEPFAGNAATEWGALNEPNAIAAYECLTGNLVDQCGDEQGFVIHPEHDWLGCTPDGFSEIAEQRIVIEAKCPASGNLYGGVPDHYMAQVQGQMAITGSELAHFAVWTPEEFEVYQVARCSNYWQECFELLAEFWEYVLDDIEPKRKKKPTLPIVDYRRIV
jgi:putative phage-type endonuclease